VSGKTTTPHINQVVSLVYTFEILATLAGFSHKIRIIKEPFL